MASFRLALSSSALALLALVAAPAVRADDMVVAALNAGTGAGDTQAVALTYLDVLGVQSYTYTNVQTDVLNTATSNFTATYADILGVQTLTVTDICAQVTVFGPAAACQDLAFAFEDLSVGDANLLSALGDASAQVDGQLAEVAFGGSVGTNTATFSYDPPPSPTPEPASLAFAATGLLGIAGIVRSKSRPSA